MQGKDFTTMTSVMVETFSLVYVIYDFSDSRKECNYMVVFKVTG